MFIDHRSRRAFTLVELLITLTLFAVVATAAVSVMVNGLRSAKRIQAQIYLYSEAQALMNQIARDVEKNTVDYEAYYSRNVLGEAGWDTPNYGYYAQSFYNPKSGGQLEGPYEHVDAYYGANCDDGSLYPEGCPDEVPNYDELDRDTGAHPFSNIDDFDTYLTTPGSMNAFCEGPTGYGSAACAAASVPFTDELLLVNGAGDERIIYVRELLEGSTDEYGLSRLVMVGTDTDNDGIEDSWACAADTVCGKVGVNGQATPAEDDFLPVSPLGLSLLSFDVLIAPSEDPYRAFAEEDAQIQPQVTLVLRLSLSEDYGSNFLGTVPTITLQRTLSTGVYSKVLSYE